MGSAGPGQRTEHLGSRAEALAGQEVVGWAYLEDIFSGLVSTELGPSPGPKGTGYSRCVPVGSPRASLWKGLGPTALVNVCGSQGDTATAAVSGLPMHSAPTLTHWQYQGPALCWALCPRNSNGRLVFTGPTQEEV